MTTVGLTFPNDFEKSKEKSKEKTEKKPKPDKEKAEN